MARRFAAWGTIPLLAALIGSLLGTGPTAQADPLGPAHQALVRYQRSHGYLPVGDDFATYERNVQARFDRWASTHPNASVGRTEAAAPVATVNVAGLADDRLAPGDPTGAAGPSSYIQFINDQMGIFTRTGTLIHSAGTAAFAAPGGADTDYSDPQILWDAWTQRFYY